MAEKKKRAATRSDTRKTTRKTPRKATRTTARAGRRSKTAPGPEGSKLARRRAILVLGMHRSGTSAITKLLGICGARLPNNPLPPSDLNARGFFESDPIFRLHEELFTELGTAWDDLAPLHESWLDSPTAAHFVARMVETVEQEFGDAALIVIKDPRVCRLVPFWREVLKCLDIEPCFVLPVRNPLEVSASLERAQEVPSLKGLLLWLQYFLQAERDSRGGLRSFVTYDRLLEDWRAVVKRVGRDLELSFPRVSRRAAAEADEFLTTSLRNYDRPENDYADREDVVAWVKETYAWAQKAALSKPPSARRLDQIWAAYCVAEAAFGPVVAHSQLDRDRRRQEAQELLSQLTELEGEVGELRGQLVPQEQLDQLHERAHAKDRQVAELIECIKLMLAWIASATPGGQAAHERLDTLLQALNGADSASIPELASQGLQRFQQSEVMRLQRESESRASELQALSTQLEVAEQQRHALASTEHASKEHAEAQALEIASLREQLITREEQLQTQHAHITALEQQCNEQLRQLGLQSSKLDEQAQQLASSDRQLETQRATIATMDDKISEQAREIAESERTVAESEGKIAESEQRIAERDREIAERDQKLVERDQEIAERDQLMAARDARLEEQEHEILEQARTLEAQIQQRNEWDAERLAQKQKIELLESQLDEQSRQIAQQSEALHDADRAHAARVAEEEVKGQRITTLESQLVDLNDRLLVQQQELTQAAQQVATLDRERTTAQEQASAQTAALEAMRTLETDRDEHIAQLEAEAERMRGEAERMQVEAERMRGEVERVQTEAELMRTELERTRGEAERTQAEAELRRTELERARGEAQRTQAEVERMRTESEERDARLLEAREELGRLEARVEALQSRLREEEARTRRQDDLREDLEAQVEALRDQLERRESEIERLREETSLAIGEIQRLHGIAARVQRLGVAASTDGQG